MAETFTQEFLFETGGAVLISAAFLTGLVFAVLTDYGIFNTIYTVIVVTIVAAMLHAYIIGLIVESTDHLKQELVEKTDETVELKVTTE